MPKSTPVKASGCPKIKNATKHLRDPEHKIDLEPIRVEQHLTIECQPVRILDSSERVMRRRTIKYVKVLWTNQSEREATWELEKEMCKKYPKLFETDDGSASFFPRARAAYTSIPATTFRYCTGPYTSVWGLLVATRHYSFNTRGSLGSCTGCSYCGSLFFD
ncbi:hypothetical protein E2562_017531 [Oryza meyeriana var. granulata]|uniref:Chromo domain-containing protein n=1 Tax=Oryza meyeriana var. granulata TaxID=110450 RepID=A0A6G1DXY7_9ORYZ|nr:hypothetical protein E2562_017531 [Oryza meyeriana var. granulata]